MAALAAVFGLLADPTRLRIVLLLRGGERNVTELCALTGLPQPTVSHHVGLLRTGGVVTGRRQGKSIYYRLHDGASADEHEVTIVTAPGGRVRIGTPSVASPIR